MESVLLALAGWLDDAGLRAWASATPWVYPVANVLHVLGLALLVGGIGVVDLRMAGLWRRLSPAELSRALTPIAIAGLALLLASGFVLFAADGRALAGSPVFRWKLLLVAMALANAAAFRLVWHRRLAETSAISVPARASAVLSLSLWFLVAILGRMIAYT